VVAEVLPNRTTLLIMLIIEFSATPTRPAASSQLVPYGEIVPMKISMPLFALLISSTASAEDFFAQMVLQDVTFQVESPNAGSINPVTVSAETSDGSIGKMETEADGTITNVQVEDLNADGYPEIYIYVNSAGSGSYGSLIAYASNKNKSLSDIYLPPIETGSAEAKGYMGHDEFAVVETTFVRRFPVYKDGDPNSAPSGGTRLIQYKLEAGEAGWILRQDRVEEY
jgi:hypothetical protein